MIPFLRRLFPTTTEDVAANIRDSIRRDNLRGINADPPYLRDEHVSEFERARRRRHIIPAENS